MSTDPFAATESVYIVRGEMAPEAIARSLQRLLPARHHPIARHRFTVLDTYDGRVRRAGARLTRAGVNGRSTLTWQPRSGRSLVAARLTQPVSFVWDLPDGPLQQQLAPVIGVRRLFAQVDAEGYGSRLDILDDRGKTVARLRIESGRARLPVPRHAWQPLPTAIILTGLRGYRHVYEQLVPVLESRPGVEYCSEGFDAVILRQVGAAAPGRVAAPEAAVAPTIRADVGARTIHLSLLGILRANEPGVRANLDTEFLHDFRVAIRRTRSLLGQIRSVFPPSVAEHFSREFSWLGHLTGPARDADVLVLALRQYRGEIAAEELDTLIAFLQQAQQHEHDRLVEALDGDRYRQLLAEWNAFLERPPAFEPDAGNAGRPLADVVSRRAWRLARRIARSAETSDEHTTVASLHRVRIDAKKLRYLIDVTPAFYEAADLTRILGALKNLQRVLGDFNDADVQEKRLLECGELLGAAGGPPGALLALGRLAEQSRQRCERLRGPVVNGLARFHDPETRSACRRAFKPMNAAERAR